LPVSGPAPGLCLEPAGIALVRRATLATRNLRHFEDPDIDLVDPWSG
jgi:hypothetical protein